MIAFIVATTAVACSCAFLAGVVTGHVLCTNDALEEIEAFGLIVLRDKVFRLIGHHEGDGLGQKAEGEKT